MTAVRKLDRRMTVEEFLAWDSGDDLVWELIDGYPVLRDYDPATGQASPSPDHGAVTAALGRLIGNALAARKHPCRLEIGSGVDHGRRDRDFRIPDLLVRCGRTPAGPGEPVLVVEVLSPANTASEMHRKHAFFKATPSIREIVELEQDEAACTVLRRLPGRAGPGDAGGDGADGGADIWVQERLAGPDAVLRLDSIDAAIPLAEVYRGILEDPGGDAGV
ncbi:Uma2 family endonuclease [Rhodocista pekingensis]|uniref:Uma2 family endonuclease n=1 Tax=Rhodocista pekingensis TaxID=201185 RepID=A0ABW2KXC6_9PROT